MVEKNSMVGGVVLGNVRYFCKLGKIVMNGVVFDY